jgi:hypothetical protein
MEKALCVVLVVPEPLFSSSFSENKLLHEKYGFYCESKYPASGEYFDVPHITLFSMGGCLKNLGKIEQRLKEIVKSNFQMEIKSDKLVLFEKDDLRHLVVTVKKNDLLQKLHNDIVNGLMEYSEKKDGFVLEKYVPHFSKIINLQKEFAIPAKKDSKIREFSFVGTHVGIKIRKQNNYCVISKKLKLKPKIN